MFVFLWVKQIFAQQTSRSDNLCIFSHLATTSIELELRCAPKKFGTKSILDLVTVIPYQRPSLFNDLEEYIRKIFPAQLLLLQSVEIHDIKVNGKGRLLSIDPLAVRQPLWGKISNRLKKDGRGASLTFFVTPVK